MIGFDLEVLYQVFLQYPTITTDSRKAAPGTIFFALRGENFDGNAYAATALAAGSVIAIVDDPKVADSDQYMVVPDVLTALHELARHHRQQMFIPIIAITGSNGKTTTKELVREVLCKKYRVLCTEGNLNNHIGVPLTLLKLREDHEVAVIEMGANHQGEIAILCEIAEPTHGLINNVGKAHLEGFGGEEGVRIGKSELYGWLANNNGLAFINMDEPYLDQLAKMRKVNRLIRYKNSEDLDVTHVPIEAQLIQSEPFVEVAFLSETGQKVVAQTQMTGQYNYPNLLNAITLGKYFKVPAAAIKQAIESYEPRNNRSQVEQRDGYRLILDAYNANPNSMMAAIDNLAKLPGHRVALLGDMRELGDAAPIEHLNIVNHACRAGIQTVVIVGPIFKLVPRPAEALCFLDTDMLKLWFDEQKWPENTTILIKGSRGMSMESVVS
jgi:UDP-N-acetylmuramoyl-tripeptide--D-alanyl-D-alanine ligase